METNSFDAWRDAWTAKAEQPVTLTCREALSICMSVAVLAALAVLPWGLKTIGVTVIG